MSSDSAFQGPVLLYRLKELESIKAIVFADEPADVDAAWLHRIPATCNINWTIPITGIFATQLSGLGVHKVAIVTGSDPICREHALELGLLLNRSLEVRLIRLETTLREYLSAHSRDALLALMKGTDPWASPPTVELPPRLFQAWGEQRYTMAVHPEGIHFEVNRLRRSGHELTGELIVRVNGNFPHARTHADGILSWGDLNFSGVQSRSTRAKLLLERSGSKKFDWHGCLEEMAARVIEAERAGKPAEILAEATDDEDDNSDSWTIDGFPLLQQLPQIVFGDSSSGKSYFAMWIAGRLAQLGITVLYADWEFSKSEHHKRLTRLFQPPPKNLLYIRCEHSLKQEVEHIADIVQKNRIKYIVCDSIGFAVEGPAESQEGASGYFRYLRQLSVGSLNIAHIPKQSEDGKEATIFGSTFYRAGARSAWFIDKAKENPNGEIRFGLYHRKNNVGALLQPKGFRLLFRGERTLMESINLKDVEELAAGYPLLDRMRELLGPLPLTAKAISEELSVPMVAVRATLSRHRSQFIKAGNRYGVATKAETDAAEANPPPADNEVDF